MKCKNIVSQITKEIPNYCYLCLRYNIGDGDKLWHEHRYHQRSFLRRFSRYFQWYWSGHCRLRAIAIEETEDWRLSRQVCRPTEGIWRAGSPGGWRRILQKSRLITSVVSNVWLDGFKKRNNISFKKVADECKSED